MDSPTCSFYKGYFEASMVTASFIALNSAFDWLVAGDEVPPALLKCTREVGTQTGIDLMFNKSFADMLTLTHEETDANDLLVIPEETEDEDDIDTITEVDIEKDFKKLFDL